MCQVWKSVIFVECYLEASQFAKTSPHYVPRGPEVEVQKNLGRFFL